VTPEAKLKSKIASLLTQRGIFFVRVKQGPGSTVGVPDIIGCWNARMFAIEVKAPGRYENCYEGCRKDSPTQYEFLRRLKLAGGLALVVDNIDDIEHHFPRPASYQADTGT